MSYYDFRNDGSGDAVLSTGLWVTHSHDGGVTFPDEDRLTTDSFDMRTAPDAPGPDGPSRPEMRVDGHRRAAIRSRARPFGTIHAAVDDLRRRG